MSGTTSALRLPHGASRGSGVVVRPIIRPDDVGSATPLLRAVRNDDDGEQQSLDLVFPSPRPFTPVLVQSDSNAARRAHVGDSWEFDGVDDPFFERQPTASKHLPEPTAWAQRYSQAWIEALAGRRPVKQLSRWSTPSVLARLSDKLECRQTDKNTRSPQGVVTGLRVDEPADGVAEVAAVVRSRNRSRALMLRLEGWDGRWVCTYAAML